MIPYVGLVFYTKIVSTLTAIRRRCFDLGHRTGFHALVSYILDLGQALSTSGILRPPLESENNLVEKVRSKNPTNPYLQECFEDLRRLCPLDAINLARSFGFKAKLDTKMKTIVFQVCSEYKLTYDVILTFF